MIKKNLMVLALLGLFYDGYLMMQWWRGPVPPPVKVKYVECGGPVVYVDVFGNEICAPTSTIVTIPMPAFESAPITSPASTMGSTGWNVYCTTSSVYSTGGVK